MDRPATLMNENTESKKFEDGLIGTGKALDHDPQESSVDLPKMILQPSQVIPLEPLIQESQSEHEEDVSFADIADVILGLFDLGQPSEEDLYSSIEAEPSGIEAAAATNCVFSSESSNDSHTSSTYSGRTHLMSEESSELSPCILPGVSGSPQEFPWSPHEEIDFKVDDTDLRKTRKATKRLPTEKGTPEYVDKRARNNVAVRRCRTKAKIRQHENELRVKKLTAENEDLRRTVALQSKQIDALKNLLSESGITLPPNFEASLQI